ncbi:MAG: MFS transporter [Candidatus Uhrbacteria bacterium]|nr:MFS transporter [Candidatus Uhrbacteria bacterium]
MFYISHFFHFLSLPRYNARMPFHPNTSYPLMSHRYCTKHAALPTLASNRLLGFAASALVTLFFPIFLYEFFNFSIIVVLVWYVVAYLVRLPLHIWAAKIFSRTGLVPSMFIGTAGLLLFYFSLYALDIGINFSPLALLGLAIVGLGVNAGFYWSPFHVDFAQFSTKGRRGREIGLYYVMQQIVGIGAPVVAGWIMLQYSYNVLFLVSIALIVASLIPLVFIPETKVQYEFGFWETFRQMYSKRYRALSFSMMAYGAESVVGIVIWPIFLYTIFEGRYLEVGLFAAVIVIIGIGFQLILGRAVDRGSKRKFLHWGTEVYALGWFIKSLVDSVLGVFAASTFHSFGLIMTRTPMDTILYEKAADSGHYIDEFTVIKETALTIGRMLMVVLLIGITSWFSITAAFIVAAIVSLGISTLSKVRVEPEI